MRVIKRDGSIQPFDENKVKESMIRSGVDEGTAKTVLKEIKSRKFNTISTPQLYQLVYKLVSKYSNKYTASIYSLKRSISNLGPSGYLFEDFIARIFEFLGQKVKVRQTLPSLCVTHELDVVGNDFFVECKYHNEAGLGTNIRDVMYSYARLLDLKDASREKGYNFKTVWVATNTRFSDDAIAYAEYWKVKLLGWRYPKNASLSRLIDKNKLYPVTLLPSAGSYLIQKLSQNNIILIKDFDNKTDNQLLSMGFTTEEINKLRYDWRQIIDASSNIKY
ncbi:ATP cone domain protein [Candidatus Tiddalikarchaeum anstoanum]|nr:ATP cone domain protein [Candidatus Tiddalikarchaeum anstoanum]